MTYVNPAASLPVRQPLFGFAAAGGDAAVPDREARLPVAGQGTVSFEVPDREPFTVSAAGPGESGLRWRIEADAALFEMAAAGRGWEPVARFDGAGIDPDGACPYWFSFDCRNRALLYGKGELRLGTSLARHALPPAPREGDDPWAWVARLDVVGIAARAERGWVWRDPVTVEPPMRVLPRDAVTMDDLARGDVTAPGSLSPVCQRLYDNVAGASFALDTPDFPDFAAAIRRSIEDEGGWCHQRLKEKASLFDPARPNPLMTYLRITLGRDQGESPGVPFVLEIWPGGHYSPVHNHAEANAVIRVLHGRIQVTLYPFLSQTAQPFGVETFGEGDVTWISPRLNQVHALRNLGREPCLTIQCYMYDADNLNHAPEFRDLIDGRITGFAPYSDADFLWFKQKMKEEWAWK